MMVHGVEVALDAYRLIDSAQPIACYICDGDNTYGAEFCRQCFAPMALAHQAQVNKIRPKTVALVGASGAGKTVYLGMLMDMLSRQQKPISALARGAFSISLQQATTAALVGGWFPDKTPNEPDRWNWTHCQINDAKRRQPLELIVPDMAGEAILEEINHPNTFPVVRSLLTKCCGVVLLIDAIRLQSGDSSQDFATMKFLAFLDELEQERNNGRRLWRRTQLPISIVFTKADQCERCFADPVLFAETHASGMLRHCRDRFPLHTFYACGVAGACAHRESPYDGRRRIPLRVEPRGIVEPLAWMVKQIARR